MKLPLATLLALVPAFAAGAPWLHDVTDPLSSRAMYEQLAAAPSMKRSGEDFSSAKYTHIVLGGGTAGESGLPLKQRRWARTYGARRSEQEREREQVAHTPHVLLSPCV